MQPWPLGHCGHNSTGDPTVHHLLAACLDRLKHVLPAYCRAAHISICHA